VKIEISVKPFLAVFSQDFKKFSNAKIIPIESKLTGVCVSAKEEQLQVNKCEKKVECATRFALMIGTKWHVYIPQPNKLKQIPRSRENTGRGDKTLIE